MNGRCFFVTISCEGRGEIQDGARELFQSVSSFVVQ